MLMADSFAKLGLGLAVVCFIGLMVRSVVHEILMFRSVVHSELSVESSQLAALPLLGCRWLQSCFVLLMLSSGLFQAKSESRTTVWY